MRRRWFSIDWDCCLGAGGEGEVFLARSLDTEELCAVKVSTNLDPDLARQHLEQELGRYQRVAGEGVVGLVAWNLQGPRPFLVFELANAGSLADEMDEMRRGGRFYHPTQALLRTRELLVCVGHVHARGMIHRDIKPSNVLRFEDGIKLADFGAGRTAARRPEDSQMFIGTRIYAAPEQLANRIADERTDIYSVGCILHEMLTGEVPDPSAPAKRTAPHSVLFLPALEELLDSMLHVDRFRRPQSARAAVARVDEVLHAYECARNTWIELHLGASPY